MIITCGQCQAKFKVAPEQIKVAGSKVRCSNCQYVFTVYRPGGEENVRPAASGEPGGDEFGDLFREEVREEGSASSPRQRRADRRRLYAGAEAGTTDEESDFAFDSDEDDPETAAGRPPLRRNRPPENGPPRDEAEFEAEFGAENEEADGEGDDENSADWREDELTDEVAGDALGLSADPVRSGPRRIISDEAADSSALRFAPEARAAVTRIKGRRPGLFLALTIFCAALIIGIYYFSASPQPLGDGFGSSAAPAQTAGPAASGPDPNGVERITFAQQKNLNHFYRKNAKAGEILIITGQARNGYDEPRNFIRLRGVLLDQKGAVLAERYVYAGNVISEEELVSLPMSEILARLSIKAGQNSQNMNIPAGQERPFMVVFDQLPPARDEYRVIPVGSSPAGSEGAGQ